MGLRKAVKNKYIIYSILYWLIAGTLICKISSLGLCTIGTTDAISQHYPIMGHVRRLLEECFGAILNGGRYVFPMVDFRAGMGENTISALNYYGLGDPFYLLTLLPSQENLPYFYSVFFYFRVYIGGLAFMLFASELIHAGSCAAYVIGALLYCFTGFTVMCNAHIIFAHAMFYIPLMMLGAEKSMDNKRKGILCVSTFCFALSGFYFLYIGSISMAIYVVYRLTALKSPVKAAIRKIFGIIAEYCLGLGLSAVIFLPAIFGFLASGRGEHPKLKIILSLPEILNTLKNIFLSSDSVQTLSVCTIGVIIIICVIFAKDRRKEKINLAMLFILSIIPFATYAMSGFGALYDRWAIVINMYIAFLAVDMFDELKRVTMRQRAVLAMVFGILFVGGKKLDWFDAYQFAEAFKSYGILLAVLLIVLPLFKKLQKEQMGMYILFAAAVFTINTNWRTVARDNDIAYLRERDAVSELIGKGAGEGDAFCRTDNERGFAEPRTQMNISLFRGYNGTMQYFSISNPYYVSSFKKWGISGGGFNVYGLDQRTVLETMCAVRYFVVRTEFASIVPYGFEYVKSTGDGEWSLYENANSLPIAYAYENVYDAEAYNQMNGLERQAVMLRAAAVEKYDGGIKPLREMDNELFEHDFTICGEDGLPKEDGIILVKNGDSIILETRLKSGGENCLLYTGEDGFSAIISIENGYTKYGIAKPPVAVNLGTAETDKTVKIKLAFSGEAAINTDDIHIIYHDLSKYSQYINELKKDTDGRFKAETNRVSGEVDFEKDKLLCFSVPYMDGWHASIDGRKTKVYLVNDMFAGIEVPKGRHKIELHYITPGIRAGAATSAMSLIIIAIYMIRKKKRRTFDGD